MEAGRNRKSAGAHMTLREALNRTLLLMRDEVDDDATDATLLSALTTTRIALVADDLSLRSHAAQTAFVAAAMLMARSGHQVFLVAPDLPLAGSQPPLGRGKIIRRLMAISDDLLPGVRFIAGAPLEPIDLAIAFGGSPLTVRATRRIRLSAGRWSGHLAPAGEPMEWGEIRSPIGALVSAVLAAGEAFKMAMFKLRPFARNPKRFDDLFAETDKLSFEIAPRDTPLATKIGDLDCISGGAITNALLYVLSCIPGVRGEVRVVDSDIADISNLNRYMLLLRSHLGRAKAYDLADVCRVWFRIEPIAKRYEPETLTDLAPLAPSVIVGVDDIPSRWAVQSANPLWLGVGATTHWSAMASFHRAGLGCARCLHPHDDPGDAPIPTVAFVSFWAGLLTAVQLLRHLAGGEPPVNEQQTYLTALRPENPFLSPIPILPACPICRLNASKAGIVAA